MSESPYHVGSRVGKSLGFSVVGSRSRVSALEGPQGSGVGAGPRA
jgi:hypothetical protein